MPFPPPKHQTEVRVTDLPAIAQQPPVPPPPPNTADVTTLSVPVEGAAAKTAATVPGDLQPTASSNNMQVFGRILMAFALLGFVGVMAWTSIVTIRGAGPKAPGDIPAVSLFLMACGFAASFPSMLTDGSGEGVSAMRVVVFMLVSIFVLLAVKVSWDAGQLVEISGTWAGILSAAFGGKVFQSFAEAMQRKGDGPKS